MSISLTFTNKRGQKVRIQLANPKGTQLHNALQVIRHSARDRMVVPANLGFIFDGSDDWHRIQIKTTTTAAPAGALTLPWLLRRMQTVGTWTPGEFHAF